MTEKYKERIPAFLMETKAPMDIEKIRVACEIGNWNTALKHCLELFVEGKIKGQKTSKSWVFWVGDAALGYTSRNTEAELSKGVFQK
ncbi:hypothetical protein G4O51_07090 [Candidatus Bathyarchaeota archaeon A05DMB-2]|jgi:hypothetical protein|nr:hypothetical protein [Candidatus Bathyarchaeota archaeon A05DMB-2]